ncbi:methyltransferase domain-containing protein, partial [Mycobacterium kubicae]|uniref:methyltransferase domain-containing protein n=3 Tax=Mycobacteriaceae TaxID=1762 RepID=UPI0013F4F13E
MATIGALADLARLCADLGASTVGQLSDAEHALVSHGKVNSTADGLRGWRQAIRQGGDPLGDTYCRLRSPVERRPLGQTYTPAPIIAAMTTWAAAHGTPARIVDPGAGSGRYLLAAAKRFPKATVVAAEIDPVAALMLRANLAVHGLGDRAQVRVGDYRALSLQDIDEPTL